LEPLSSQLLIGAVVGYSQPVVECQYNRFAVREVFRITVERINGDLLPDWAVEWRRSPAGVRQTYRPIILLCFIVDIDHGTLSGRKRANCISGWSICGNAHIQHELGGRQGFRGIEIRSAV